MTRSRINAWLEAALSWMESVGTRLDGLAPTHWGC
jgi:hypothetical protein